MSNFKVGDQVKILDASSAPAHATGDIGTVRWVSNSGDIVSVLISGKREQYYPSAWLALVPTFKAGDRVRLIIAPHCEGTIVDVMGNIVTVTPDGFIFPIPGPASGIEHVPAPELAAEPDIDARFKKADKAMGVKGIIADVLEELRADLVCDFTDEIEKITWQEFLTELAQDHVNLQASVLADEGIQSQIDFALELCHTTLRAVVLAKLADPS